MTNKIVIDRAVVEQALKALERADRIAGYKNNWAETVALRAALEQPVEQEPVAEITCMDEYGPMLGWHKHWVEFPVGTLIYIHPQPPRQPLTDDEIEKLFPYTHEWLYEIGLEEATKFARSIEAAHGIGGEA